MIDTVLIEHTFFCKRFGARCKAQCSDCYSKPELKEIKIKNPMLDAAMIFMNHVDGEEVELYREKSLRNQRIYPDGKITKMTDPIIKAAEKVKKDKNLIEYVRNNKQKRGLGIFVHGFTVAWFTGAICDGAPVYVSLLPLVIVGVFWGMSWLNFTKKHV